MNNRDSILSENGLLKAGDLCEWMTAATTNGRRGSFVTRYPYRSSGSWNMEKISIHRLNFTKNFLLLGIDWLDDWTVELTILDPMIGRWYYFCNARTVKDFLRKVELGKG